MHTGLEFFDGNLLDHGRLGLTFGVMVLGQIVESTPTSIRQGPVSSKNVASMPQVQGKRTEAEGLCPIFYRARVFPCRIKVGMARYLSLARFLGVFWVGSETGRFLSVCPVGCVTVKKEVATHRLSAVKNPCLKP